MDKKYKEDFKKMIQWAQSDAPDCECEESFITFAQCCGKHFDINKAIMQMLDEKAGPGKRFKDLSKEKQDELLNETFEDKK